ncbi:MAG TPA: methionine--tRNA ligase [Tepidisphaeraceae bacterium]|jgi:methionyl-tRNA synthetase
MSSTFYITTPIYYPNGDPHLGSVYTTVICDAVARYHRGKGEETYFLTGTDEHGTKLAKAAAEAKVEPQQLVDRYAKVFEDLWKELEITNNDFIRTTQSRHKQAVAKIVEKMLSTGDIYLGAYEGWYDEGQEQFVTETEAKAAEFKSTISGRPLVRYKEPTYFFKLTKYVPQVIAHIEANPEFIIPQSRRNEVLSKLRAGVEDLSISRATLTWGIPLPNDPSHVIYVWIDALTNYITALGYASENDSLYRKFWPGYHVIGKDILWFHTVYWPAMLLSIGESLPKQVIAHGWWTAEGKKMSKSLGNVIDVAKIRSISATHSLDAVRYYILRAAPFGSDLDWSEVDFNKAFNELANVVGNCLNRTIKMIAKKCGGAIPQAGGLEQIDRDLMARNEALGQELDRAYEAFELQQAAVLPVELARATNGYIDATQPFKEPNPERVNTVLNLAAQSIKNALVALVPILPEKAAAGLSQLNVEVGGKTLTELLTTPLAVGHRLGEGQPLFPKVETKP